MVAAFGGLVSEVDTAALTGAVRRLLRRRFHKALENGIAGWLDDDLAFVRPWGFDLADITVPSASGRARQDLMVPFAHGQWLAAHVPGATVHLYDEHGHLSLTEDHVPAILADLAATARARGE